MPVTAKLSREFYERFGDSVANELVEMLNTVDQNYRTELRELNDLNFARFDAKVEQRFAESAAVMDKRFADLQSLIDRTQGRLLMWSFSFWVTTLIALYAFTRQGH